MLEPEFYDVEKILDKKKIRGKYKYLIKWKGYPMDQCTWEPLSNLQTIKKMLQEFESKFENKDKDNTQLEKKIETHQLEKKGLNIQENPKIEKQEKNEKKEKKGKKIKQVKKGKKEKIDINGKIEMTEKKENNEYKFLNKKRKNSESSLKSTEEDLEEIKEESIISDNFIKSKESLEKIISVNFEKGELIALVERKDKNERIKKEKIKTKDLKKSNPWILVNYYESNVLFC